MASRDQWRSPNQTRRVPISSAGSLLLVLVLVLVLVLLSPVALNLPLCPCPGVDLLVYPVGWLVRSLTVGPVAVRRRFFKDPRLPSEMDGS